MLGNTVSVTAVRGALLVDADNFHDPDQLRAVHGQFGQHVGKGFICHVHGDAKLLHKDSLRPVWQEMAARLMPCLPLNKNTTDAALVIDALMLHFQQGVRRFGIVSGDADFAPLSLQLRELGCEVTCFARMSIAFDAMVAYYDRVVRFDVLPDSVFSAPSKPSAAASVLPGQPHAADATHTTAAVVAGPRPALAKVSGPVASPKADGLLADMCVASSVDQVLRGFPALRDGAPQHLSQVMQTLKKQGIAKSGSKAKAFFAPLGSAFELRPAVQPNHVVYRNAKVEQGGVSPGVAVLAQRAELGLQGMSPEVRAWPTLMPRRSTIVLPESMNALRMALSSLAVSRVCAADVLIAVPELVSGAPCSFSSVAGRLREKGLLRSNQSAQRIFERVPESFTVNLQASPPWVRYLT